jgi:amino acid permease
VAACSYSTIAWGASVHKGRESDVDYSLRATTTPGKVFGVLAGLGTVAFAYSGHNVVLEIQATIPSTPEKPSKKPMWKGVVVAYIIVAICYLPVSFVGYWVFGNAVDEDILITLNRPRWLIAAANMMVVIHVIGSYQVYAMPVFDMMETVLVKKLRFRPGLRLRLVSRTVYVGNASPLSLPQLSETQLFSLMNKQMTTRLMRCHRSFLSCAAFTMFVGITFPFFDGLLSFFGGFAFAPTSYYVLIKLLI